MSKTKVKLHVGDRLLAFWYQDEFWYPATVKAIKKEKDCNYNNIYVQFDDGDKQWSSSEDVLDIDIELGDRVHAKWGSHEYFPAHILEIKKGSEKTTPVRIQYEEDDHKEWTTLQMLRVTR